MECNLNWNYCKNTLFTTCFSRRFLDERLFATCSDDSTVALYDTRNLKTKIRTLRGHSNWVKNIEYSKRDCLLVTSGFDGSIFTWDLNSYTETNLTYQKVFHTPGELWLNYTINKKLIFLSYQAWWDVVCHLMHQSLSSVQPVDT